MKQIVLFLIVFILCSISSLADRYVVDCKEPQLKLYEEMTLTEGEWHSSSTDNPVLIDKGYEFEPVKEASDKYFVVQYQGKYYKIWTKDIKRIDTEGNATRVGHRKLLGSSALIDWFMSSRPGLVGLFCAIIAFITLITGILRENPSAIYGWIFGCSMSAIAVIETLGLFSVGSDTYWWVDPDEVGYLIAIIMLFPFSLTMAMQIFAFKFLKLFPIPGKGASIAFKILIAIGGIIAVVASLQVIFKFLFAAFCLGLFLWMGTRKTYYKDYSGNVYESGMFGTGKLTGSQAEDVKQRYK